MIDFKDLVRHDIGNVFLNPSELGEPHEIIIDGEEIRTICIVQDVVTSDDLTIKRKDGIMLPGAYGSRKMLNIAKQDLPDLPKEGQIVYLDEKGYEIESVSDDMGIATIILVSNEV